jgi:putative sterol carrier protein
MVAFLTDAWVAALDDAAAAFSPAPPIDAALEGLVVGYAVGDFAYHLVFSTDAVQARSGAHDAATVTFRCDRATATAIARGEASAQRAFMAGNLRIGGDASALLRAHGAIAALPDLFAAVRDRTDFGAHPDA